MHLAKSNRKSVVKIQGLKTRLLLESNGYNMGTLTALESLSLIFPSPLMLAATILWFTIMDHTLLPHFERCKLSVKPKCVCDHGTEALTVCV